MAVVTEAVELEGLVAQEVAAPPPNRRRMGLEQMGVAAGQMAAGVGNLLFTLVMARVLAPTDFARLSVFLGLYLVLSLPGTSLSAATALAPARRDVLLRRVQAASLALSVAGAAVSPWLAPPLHLPVVMLLVLAAAVPAAGLLALERGRLYGRLKHRRIVTSLLAEPVVRLSLGVVLAVWTGAAGGAVGVVLAAYLALEVARKRRHRGHRGRGAHAPARRRVRPAGATGAPAGSPAMTGAGWTAAAFALLAVVQNQDLVFANALLPGPKAGLYAALSTLGGAAAFATITVPLVLMPRAVRGERNSTGVAVGLTVAIAAAAVATGALASTRLVTGLFGARYSGASHLVVPYLAAMGLLGIARVLVAERCATGRGRRVTFIVIAAAGAQAVAIALAGHGVDAIAMTTLVTTATLTAVLAGERLADRLADRVAERPAHRERRAERPDRREHRELEAARPDRRELAAVRLRGWAARLPYDPAAQVVTVALVAGLAVRLIVWRGLWLDEATSVHQVHMSFSGMIANLRDTDVHPPLYFAVLWLTVRVVGYGSMAIRIPSIVAGLLIVPAAYLAGRDLWDRRTGMVAASLASVAPLIVWYSQEVRMYSMFMLFAVLAIWGQGRALRRGRPADWAIYVLASAGLAWTEYFGLFQVAAQQAFFLWVLVRGRREREGDRSLLVGWVASTAVLAVMILPLAPFALHQFAVNQNAGKGFGAPSQTTLAGTESINVYTVLANLVWAVVGYHSGPIMEGLVALWPLGILLSLFVLGRRATRDTKLVVVAAVVPAAMLLAAGMEKRFLYDVRYMSGVAVALLLLASRMVTGATRSSRFQVLGCLALVAVLTTGLVDEQFNGTNPRLYDFSGALGTVDRQWRPGDLIVYSPQSIWVVVDYYSPHTRTEPLSSGLVPSQPSHPTSRLPSAPAGSTIFVLESPNLMNPSDMHNLSGMLTGLRRFDLPTRVIRRSNVTVWTFLVPPGAPNALTRPMEARS